MSVPQSCSIDPNIQQLTATTYRDPSQIVPGRTLVVGDGASGRDIAAELSANHKVLLATGKPRKLIPEFFLGKNVWWWFSTLGVLSAPAESWLGKRMRTADPFPTATEAPRPCRRGVSKSCLALSPLLGVKQALKAGRRLISIL